ncbi:hypothetical protein [Kaistia hirudinis]|nr:hypothetical protein [Kaistia hirudinis]
MTMVKTGSREEGQGTGAAGGQAPDQEGAKGTTGPAAKAAKGGAKDARAERLAAALRTNLQRRKQARRNGLDDFGEAAGTPEEE